MLDTQARTSRCRVCICKDKVGLEALPDLRHSALYGEYTGLSDNLTKKYNRYSHNVLC